MDAIKHTPGPWAFDAESGEIIHKDGDVNPVIATVHFDNTEPERAVADGFLLAAAAELDAAAAEAWIALAWLINYDSEDGIVADAMASIENARQWAGTFDYHAMRCEVDARGAEHLSKAEGRS